MGRAGRGGRSSSRAPVRWGVLLAAAVLALGPGTTLGAGPAVAAPATAPPADRAAASPSDLATASPSDPATASPTAPAAGVVPRDAAAAGPGGPAGLVAGTARCSAGLLVRTPAGTPRLLTAGHCTREGGTVRAADTGRALGEVRSSRYGPGGDWGVVDLAVSPQVRADPASAALARVAAAVGAVPAAVAPAASLAVGTPVCRSGATTGRQCGSVVAVGVTADYGAGPIGGLVAVSACSEPGDSGGPVVTGDGAAGLVSGGTGDCARGGVTLVQPLEPVLAREGLLLVTR